MRAVSEWNWWRKSHSTNWVRQNWRDWCRDDGGEPGAGSRDEGKHTKRNDLLFVKKMVWMGEQV